MKLEFDAAGRPFAALEQAILAKGYRLERKDEDRPWGGFFVLVESDAARFAAEFFPELDFQQIQITQHLSPKFLLVAPHQRLSWQYHFRRAELWKVLQGPVGVATSNSDEQGPVRTYAPGESLSLAQGQRHRLVGLDHWGLVAEIWQHTDPDQPSDESDIVRLQDDFGR